MKSFLAAALLLAAGAAHAAPLPEDRVDALMAFARTYGVVRYFHPSDSVMQVDWDRFLVHAAARVSAGGPGAELDALFAPIVEGFRVAAAGTTAAAPAGEGPAVEWRHLGYGMEPTPRIQPFVSWRTHHPPLHDGKVKGSYFQHEMPALASAYTEPVVRIPVGRGREAHVPASLPMPAVKVGAEQKARLDALAAAARDASPAGADKVTRAQALADGIAAWNVARHFHPYWPETQLDWEAQLRRWLGELPETLSRTQLRDALRALVAPLADGHVRILDPGTPAPAQAYLPVGVRAAGARWIVHGSSVAAVRPGDLLVAVDGVPVERFLAPRLALESGTEHYRRSRVAFAFSEGTTGQAMRLRFARGLQAFEATLRFDQPRPVPEVRPPAIHEVKPGIWYVDLVRYDKAEFARHLERLAAAKGVVFDLRGYPPNDAFNVVPYWLTGPDASQWITLPRFDRPGGQFVAGWSTGWQMSRDPALEKPAKALLTDARAISFAESIASYFATHKAGAIVGEATAGANGNVATATLPSGMKFLFTGLRVTRHDGSRLHGVGIAPGVPVTPTPEGLRAQRDEILERAIAEVEARAGR